MLFLQVQIKSHVFGHKFKPSFKSLMPMSKELKACSIHIQLSELISFLVSDHFIQVNCISICVIVVAGLYSQWWCDTVVCQLYFPQKTNCRLWLSKRARSCVSWLGRVGRRHVCMVDCPSTHTELRRKKRYLVPLRWVLLLGGSLNFGQPA